MNERIEVDINRELLAMEINPNDPCGCFIHEALVGLYPDVVVGYESIGFDGKTYYCTRELSDWQEESVEVFNDANDDDVPLDIDSDETVYPEADDYECVRIEFTEDGEAGIVESYD